MKFCFMQKDETNNGKRERKIESIKDLFGSKRPFATSAMNPNSVCLQIKKLSIKLLSLNASLDV